MRYRNQKNKPVDAIKIDTAWWAVEAMNDTETSVFACTAGLGSGKTHGGIQWHDYRVRTSGTAPFSGFMEPTYQKIHDAAIPTFRKVFQSYGMLEGVHFDVVKSPHPKIIYKQLNHEILFFTAERPDLLVAVELGFGTEDEAGTVSAEASRNFRLRVRDSRCHARQVMRLGAPQGINHFAEEFDSFVLDGWERPHSRDHYKVSVIENVIVKRRRFICWTDDNPKLPPDYIPNLMDTYGHNPAIIQSYRYGLFTSFTEGLVYSNYLPARNDCEDLAPSPMREIIFTWDFNANPITWTALQKMPFEEWGVREHRWTAIHECQDAGGDLEQAVVEFAQKFPVNTFRTTKIKVYGDRTGHAESHKISGSDFENIERHLRALGYRNIEICAARQVAPEASSVEAVQRLLANSWLLVCRRCKLLRRSFLMTKWKEGQRKIEKPAGETHTHPGDSVKYFAWQIARDENGTHSNSGTHGKNI